MEIVPYILDVLMFTFAIYWSAANAAAKPGTKVFGLFRYRETPGVAATVDDAARNRRRVFQPQQPAPAPRRPPTPGPAATRPGPAGRDSLRTPPTRRLPGR